jgi:ankyrin repeat protein
MACRHKDQQLIDAAYEGDLAKVKAMIAAGVDVNARDDDGKTAPSTAKENVHDDHIKLLKAAGAQS